MCTVGGRIGWIVTRSGTARRPGIPGTTTVSPSHAGGKFEEGLEAKDRLAATSVAAKDGSGSEEGFTESESPVVQASIV